ncbi:hypothetical protein [Amycolatopsis minnesotensis]|uniref:Htaa protein n=1 Tax=Amycolatopsis minnesotensis TaxID=337894 RepID=A0ABP5BP59_9PSEU
MRRTLASAVAVLAAMMVAPVPAEAAGARVAVSPATADPQYATVLTVRGSGFQSVPKGFGGIYLLFGWVADGGWQPSKGGASGATYRYVPDKEAKDNRGFQRFIAFPGGDTASSANGGTIAADGSWQAQIVVPGARFKATDRNGAAVDVDCLATRCGLITVGAHGVVNATNETFTPVTFAVPKPKPAPAAPPVAPPPPPPPTSAPPQPTPSQSPSPVPTTTAPVTADHAAAADVKPAASAESSTGVWWLIGIAAVVVLAAVGTPLVLRRRRAGVSPDSQEKE